MPTAGCRQRLRSVHRPSPPLIKGREQEAPLDKGGVGGVSHLKTKSIGLVYTL